MATAPKKPKAMRLRAILPDLWEIVKPLRGQLLASVGLIIIARCASLVLPASTKFLIDDIIGKQRHDMLTPLVSAVVAATLVQAACSFTVTQILSKAAQRVIADMRRKIQMHIGRLSVAYFDRNKTGELVSRIMYDVEGLRNLVGTGLVEFFGGILTAILALAILFNTSAVLTLLALAIVVGISVGMFFGFNRMRPIFKERGKIYSEVTGRLQESLGGVRVIKGYHAEHREESVFSGGVDRLLANILKSLTGVSAVSQSAVVLLGLIGSLVMWIGTREILAGHLTLGQFVTFTAFLAFLVAPIFGVVSIGSQLTEALAGLERTKEVLSELREDHDPSRTHVMPPINGRVEFRHVDFAYEEGKPVLQDFSFLAEPGTVTALVGSSGSGKSTTIGLIAAFAKPQNGHVLVDNVDIATVTLASYREQLGVVLQETFLFDGTIRENVAFSRPEANEEQIMAAIRIARVDDYAEKFPDKYDTVVGERGVRLSGGQKQRVAIARAILADPRILILDEATSSLDSESEAYIQAGLSHLMKGRTTFVIAHRLSTIRRADQILVVESGRIVESGNHDTLLAAGGRYAELYRKQYDLEKNLFLAEGEGDTIDETEPEPAPSPYGRAG
ncbi:MAG: ABC transporter ATP-binding protein [Acidobacteria bacterium]|nr:ABC transporter ATP-binding protein [Acidobacteriota bacterium]